MNGLQALAAMMGADPFKAPGTFTSGRRTWLGNQKVGGVPNSAHLRGEAADFTGTSKNALQSYFGPDAKVGWHKNHWHVSGLEDVPYHGPKGTTGLVDGKDTTMPSYFPLPKRQDELTPAEMAARAAAFNVQIPGSATEGINQATMMGAMLPQSVQQELPQAMMQAQGQQDARKKHSGLFPGNDMAAIAGILGDALMAYGGLNPSFGPMMAQKSAMEREQELALERERIKAAQKAQEPPAFIKNARWFQSLPPEEQRQVLSTLDATSPIAVSGPQGTMRVPRTMGGPPPEAVAELRSAVAQGDTSAIAEFEAVFGPGSASSILGR